MALAHRGDDAAPAVLDDPIAFAHELYSNLARDGDERLINPPRADYARYKAAIRAARALHSGGTGAEHPDELADEAAHAWAAESYAAGVEFGVAAEQLRRSILDGGAGPGKPWHPAPPAWPRRPHPDD